MVTSPPSSSTDIVSEGPAFSPLYQQIKVLITRSLQGGEWRPGEAIPSEMELAARYKVSQGTVRKAIDAMADENLLVRRQGRGTFVATHAEEKIQFRFLRLKSDGGEPAKVTRRVIDCRRLRAPAEVCRLLELTPGDIAVHLKRVLSFKGLTAERLSEYRGPMYGLFETEFGVRMIRAEEQLRAVAADAAAADALQLPLGAPLLSVERLSLTYDDKPVELRSGLYNTESHYYRNELS
jgi:GntR family transcriptional regulator